MTSSADAGTPPRVPVTQWRRPGWPQVAGIVAALLLAFFVARSCQQAQIRITKEQAIATAEEQVDFSPANTQIRLLRQGLARQPFWIVSLSIPRQEGKEGFSHLAVVRVDANTGKVEEVIREGRQPQPSEP